MNTQQLLAQIKAYPLAVGLAVAAVLMAVLAYFRQDTLAAIEAQNVELTQQDKVMTENLGTSANLQANLEQLRADLKVIEAGFIDPSPRNISRNKEFFRDFERTTGITITDCTQDRWEPLRDAAGREPDLKTPGLMSVTTFNVTATGRWQDMTAFLYGLSTSPQNLRTLTFRLGKDTRMAVGPRSADDIISTTLKVEILGKIP